MAMDPELVADFLNEAQDLVDAASSAITALETAPDDADTLNRLFRAFHTVKGGAGFIGITTMVDLCHSAEDYLSEVRAGRLAMSPEGIDACARALSETERMLGELAMDQTPTPAPAAVLAAIASARHPDGEAQTSDVISDDEFEALLDSLHGNAPPAAVATSTESGGEDGDAGASVPGQSEVSVPTTAPKTVTQKAEAAPSAAKAPPPESNVRVDAKRLDKLMDLVGELVLVRNRLKSQPEGIDEHARRAVAELDHVTGALQRGVMAVRMQPVGRLFSRIPRMVRELARDLDKEVAVVLEGESAELDKHLLDALGDPLVHLVRNSLDHGFEPAAARKQAGKPARGTLRVAARQAGDHIEILLADDGRGIDPDVVRGIAVKRGVLTEEAAARLDTAAAQALIFAAGFSTRETVSDVSGRGVGMDVVKSRLQELGGSVALSSEPGVGTQIRLRLPLTLAVLPSLMVRVDGRVFALPLAEVQELTALDVTQVERVGRRWQVPIGKSVLPLCFLRGWMHDDAEAHAGLIVQTRVDDHPWGLVVDSVIGREDIVVRPLAKHLRGIDGYSGATVTGRGEVALVLDPQTLVMPSEHRQVAA